MPVMKIWVLKELEEFGQMGSAFTMKAWFAEKPSFERLFAALTEKSVQTSVAESWFVAGVQATANLLSAGNCVFIGAQFELAEVEESLS